MVLKMLEKSKKVTHSTSNSLQVNQCGGLEVGEGEHGEDGWGMVVVSAGLETCEEGRERVLERVVLESDLPIAGILQLSLWKAAVHVQRWSSGLSTRLVWCFAPAATAASSRSCPWLS